MKILCDYCGKSIERYPSQIKPMNFCSRACLGKAVTDGILVKNTENTSAHMTAMNKRMNPSRMDFNARCKLRAAHLGTGRQSGYAKRFGKHEHVVIAETALGRALLPDEVVHHIDRDKRNNALSNLVVLTRRQHASLHYKCRGQKEVMSDEFQALSVSASQR